MTPTMRKGCVINFWRRSLSALSASSSSISSSSSSNSSKYVNESVRVFEMKRRRKTSRPVSSSYGGGFWRKNKKVSYGGLQAAYIKNCGLVVESYQMVEQSTDVVFFPWDDLLREYVKKKRIVEASRIFDIMPERSTVSWHLLILGYIKIGRMSQANKIFQCSPKAGTVWESMICGYGRHGLHDVAQEIFYKAPGENMLTRQMLLAGMYIGGSWDDYPLMKSCHEITLEADRNTATWNIMIQGNLFQRLRVTAKSYLYMMDTYGVNSNVMSWNITFAGLIGIPDYSCRPLRKIPTQLRNSHSWNLMIAARSSFDKEEIDKFLEEALTIFHIHIPENQRNTASWNALIYLLVEQEKLVEARFYLDNMPPEIRNPHSWGLMIAGYLYAEMFDEAKNIFFDKNIRVCDDLHSWVLILRWFVRNKMVDEARGFLVNNVPKRPLSFYSIAFACIKHEFREESKLVLESMQATMHTNLNIDQTITFMEEKLKEKHGSDLRFQRREDYKNWLKAHGCYEWESHAFLKVLNSNIDANGDCTHIFLKGSYDCCGLLQMRNDTGSDFYIPWCSDAPIIF